MPSLAASMQLHNNNRDGMEAKNVILQHYLNSLQEVWTISWQMTWMQPSCHDHLYFLLQGAVDRNIPRQDPVQFSRSGRSPPTFFPFGMNTMPNKFSPRSDSRQSNAFSTELAEIFSNCHDRQPALPFGMRAFSSQYSALFQQHLYQLALASAAQNGRLEKVRGNFLLCKFWFLCAQYRRVPWGLLQMEHKRSIGRQWRSYVSL